MKDLQTLNIHKQNYTSILTYLGLVEVRGQENIQRMYNLMGFLQSEIQKIEEQEKSPTEEIE